MDRENKLEEEILASFERGEWQPVSRNKSEIARFAAMASASLAKTSGSIFVSPPEILMTFKQRPQKKRFLIRR